MTLNTSKADYYRSQIEAHEQDVTLAEKTGRIDRADFFRREISITKMLLETVLQHGDDFGSGARDKQPEVASLTAANQAAQKLRAILKSALGPTYYEALSKGRTSAAKLSDPRSAVEMAADLLADLGRAASEARAAGAAARATVMKARLADQKDREEAAKLRAVLQKAALLRKDARWSSAPMANRRQLDEAERAGKMRLAVIVAKRKARSDASQATAKHHQAMVERGVTFSRMMQL
jgi:hypothetical protein